MQNLQLPERWFQQNFLLWACFVLHDEEKNKPLEHKHNDFYELVIVAEGNAVQVLDDESETVAAGNVFLVHPGETHRYEMIRKFGIYNICFERPLLQFVTPFLSALPGYDMLLNKKKYAGTGNQRGCLRLAANHLHEVLQEAETMAEAFASRQAGFKVLMLASFLKLIYLVCKNSHFPGVQDMEVNARIAAVVEFIRHKYDTPLSLRSLAKYAGMSTASFRRHFTRMMGIAPIDYLLQFRLKNAREMLVIQDVSISDIAYRTGFQYGNYFARQFRKQYGMTPSEYRQMYAASISEKQQRVTDRNRSDLHWLDFHVTDRENS